MLIELKILPHCILCSTLRSKIQLIGSSFHEIIEDFPLFLQAAYKETLDNLNQSIAIALQDYSDANIRVREADEKFRLLHNNVHKQQYDYEAMKRQLEANFAAAEKLNLLKVTQLLIHYYISIRYTPPLKQI